MSRSDLNTSRWLEAHADRAAGLTTLPRNIILSNISGDGDYRLILTDLKLGSDVRSRMKVYKGTMLTTDQILPDIPCGIISFYMDNFSPKVPAIAVACGLDLLVYKNNKPYFKFTTPTLTINSVEREVWNSFKEYASCNIADLVETLNSVPYHELTPRSQQLLSLPTSQHDEFIQRYVNVELMRNTPITCITTLNKSSSDKNAVSCPVVGTEAGQIFILDPQSFSIIHQATVATTKTTPFIIETMGLFDVEFKIIIACREGYVSILRRGWLEGKIILQTIEYIVDMIHIPGDNFIQIATNDKKLLCYTKKGNKVWSTTTSNKITCLCLVNLKHLNASLTAVGLKDGTIHLYKGRQKVDTMQAPDTPSAMVFGQMGQEEHVMIVVTLQGAVNFKILKRTADFNLSKQDSNTFPALQTKPLPLPKRSKLFIEQSMRERQNAMDIHRNFQQDLVRLRLTAARSLLQIQSDQTGIGNDKEFIKLSAQVLGLGPNFTLTLSLENISSEKPITGLSIIFHCKPTVYKLSSYSLVLPLIPAGLCYKIQTSVQDCMLEPMANLETGIPTNQFIRVFIFRKNQAQPVLAATINMPPTDLSSPIL